MKKLKVAIKSVSSGGYLDGRDSSHSELFLTSRAVDVYLEWTIEPTGDGYVALHSVSGGRYIDGRSPDQLGGASLLLTSGSPIGNSYLNWKVVLNPNKTLSFLSRSSGGYLDGRSPAQVNQGNQVFLTQRDPSTDYYLQWHVIAVDAVSNETLRDILTSATEDSLMPCCAMCSADHSECRPLCVMSVVNTVQASSDRAKFVGGIIALAAPQAAAPARPVMPPLVPNARGDVRSAQDPAHRKVLFGHPPALLTMAVGAVPPTAVSHYAWVGLRGNGYVSIHWTGVAEKWDWIGLYSSSSKGPNDYLTYQWATNGSSYNTNEHFVSGLSVRYFRWSSAYKYYYEMFRSSDLNLNTELNVADERLLARGCWVSPTSNANTKLNWVYKPSSSSYDWVGLFLDGASDSNYVTWQWACKGTSYDTGKGMYAGYHARYYMYNASDKRYVCLRYSKQIGRQYLDVNSIYSSSGVHTLAVTDALPWVIRVAYDQLLKAVRQEPSIFSVGIWPLGGDNLLWKNLSRQEFVVITTKLQVAQWVDCLLVYYGTYQLAINIADDSERNAKRHVYWQVEMCRKFGQAFAKEIGAAHEVGRPGSDLDNVVDEHNNAVALEYCAAHPAVSGTDAANILWSSGSLQGYDSASQLVKESPQPADGPERTHDEL